MRKLGLGTWFLDERAWPRIDTQRAKRFLHHAWDRGVRHFDTAESYGAGRAEQLLGQALRRPLRTVRDDVHLATKSVVRPPDSLRTHLERSLRRMGVDFVDTFYIHWPRDGIDLAAAVEELARNRERGLLRRIGLCNVSPTQLQEAERAAPVDTVQFGYNLIWRAPEAQGLTSLPHRRIAYSVLGQGLLARAFQAAPVWDQADHRPHTPLFRPPLWHTVHAFQQMFVEQCQRSGFAPAAVAVMWAANRVDQTLIGARSPGQLDDLLDGLIAVETRPEDLKALLERLTRASTDLQSTLPDLPNMFGYVPTPCRSR
ncbi:MAG: aldo/keto reductase [Alkalispirochaeta sp.]